MLKAVVEFFWPQNKQEIDLSLDKAYSLLNQDENEISSNKGKFPLDDYMCSYKTGIITQVTDKEFTIDNEYVVNSDIKNLKLGTKVSFILFAEKDKISVTNVSVVDDDWESQDCTAKETGWCQRVVIAKVVGRNERKFSTNVDGIDFDLNEVRSHFIPTLGDWIEIDAKCAIDECVSNLQGKLLEINYIRPLRPRIVEGKISFLSKTDGSGAINNSIFFFKEALLPFYIPIKGDKIAAEIIESVQGKYAWRALKVVPNVISKTKPELLINYDFPKQILEVQGVKITEDIILKADKFNEEIPFEIEIKNESGDEITLKNIEIYSLNSQITLENKMESTTVENDKELRIKFICNPKSINKSKELVVFVFQSLTKNEFKIQRDITIDLEIENIYKNQGSKSNKKCVNTNRVTKEGKELILGQQPCNPPKFIANRLGDYPVPSRLFDFLLKTDTNNPDPYEIRNNLLQLKPSLSKELCFQTYEDYFHTLLHVEEIEIINLMCVYNKEKTCFVKNGEYLMLEIENLAEKRPSLMCGDKVLASDPNKTKDVILEGFIHKVGAKHVYLKFNPTFHEKYNGEDYSISVEHSRTLFRKMHQAVALAVKNLGRDILFPCKLITKCPQVCFDYDICGDNIRNSVKVSNGENNSPKLVSYKNLIELMKPQIKFKLEWYNKNLNYYQKEAVRNILLGESRPLPYIIFGPPGTGKTVTLVEIILQITRLIPHSRILIGTPSNSAADLIALRLIATGILKPGDLVRLVSYKVAMEEKIPIELIPYCATVCLGLENTCRSETIVTSNGLTFGLTSSAIGRHRVTVGTCGSLGSLYSMGFSKSHFTHFVVDEAGQATEPEIMIPLSLMDRDTGQIILAGDPMQLNPVVLSQASSLGLSESYLERLINRFPYLKDIDGFPNTHGFDPKLVTKLIYNYRSLSEILHVPNLLFYDGELQSAISETSNEQISLLRSLRQMLPAKSGSDPPAVVFHGVQGEELQTEDSPSWFNPDEASQVFYYFNELMRLGISSRDIGIISPYAKQAKVIKSLLIEAEFELPKVGTVEEFQGQECNIIILSTVRTKTTYINSDIKYTIGFVGHPKRLNVALTRAQSLLIIIGNPNLLIEDTLWRTVLKFCIENESYCGCEFSLE